MFPFVTRFIFRSTHERVVSEKDKYIKYLESLKSENEEHIKSLMERTKIQQEDFDEVKNQLHATRDGGFYPKSVRDMCRSLVTMLNVSVDEDGEKVVPANAFLEKFDDLSDSEKQQVYKIMYKILGKTYDSSKH